MLASKWYRLSDFGNLCEVKIKHIWHLKRKRNLIKSKLSIPLMNYPFVLCHTKKTEKLKTKKLTTTIFFLVFKR